MELRCERHRDPCRHLWVDVDVGEAGDAERPEHRPTRATLPDDGVGDRGERIDRFARIHPNVGSHHRVASDEDAVGEHCAIVYVDPAADVDAAADDRAAETCPVGDPCVVEDDGAVKMDVGPHPHAVANHGVGAEPRPGADANVVADDARRLQECRGVDRRAVTDVDAGSQFEARGSDAGTPVEHVVVGLVKSREGADVGPIAVGHVAKQRSAVVEDLREHLLGEVHRTVGGDAIEDGRFEDVDAGVHRVREDLAPRRLLDEPGDRSAVFGRDDAELGGIGDGGEDHGRTGAPFVVEASRGLEIHGRHDVAREHDEGVLEEVSGVADRACGPERRLLLEVADTRSPVGAVAEIGANGRAQVGHGDDDVVNAIGDEEVDDAGDHGPVRDREQRLRSGRGEGPKAGSLASGDDDSLHGAPPGFALVGVPRYEAGGASRDSLSRSSRSWVA